MARTSKAGAVYLLGIGIFLMLIGGVFGWLMWRSYGNAVTTRHWDEIPCLIIQSEVESRTVDRISTEYSWAVEYQYQVGEEIFVSRKSTMRGAKWTKEIENAEERVKEFPVGSERVCYVNPEKREQSILIHDTKAAGYTIWFPGLFAIGGLGMCVGAVRNLFLHSDKSPK